MKKLIFLLLFCFFSFFVCSDSYADTYIVQLPELPTSNTYDNYIISKVSDTDYRLYFIETLNEPQKTFVGNCSHYVLVSKMYYYSYIPGDTSWTFVSSGSRELLLLCKSGLSDSICINDYRTFIYSNFDVVVAGTTYFQTRPFTTDGFEENEDTSILTGIGNFFNTLFEKLGSWFGSVIDYIKSIPSSIAYLFTNLGDLLSGLLDDIIKYIKAIPQSTVDLFKTLFEFLFVPSDNLFDDVRTMFDEKFGFVSQIIEFGQEFINVEFQTDTPHFSVKLYGKEYDFIDFSFYDKYKNFIHNIIICISYTFFGFWLLEEGPSIIHGFGRAQLIDKTTIRR